MADGKCTNFGGECSKAENDEIISVPEGADFVCDECGKPLIKVSEKPNGKKKVLAGVAALLVIIAAGLIVWFGDGESPPKPESEPQQAKPAASEPSVPPDQIREHLEKGEFARASEQLNQASASDPQMDALKTAMNMPVSPRVKFQFKFKGKPASEAFLLDAPELQALSLAHEDSYRLFVEFPASEIPLYLYIYQKDHFGRMDRIFPDPIYSGAANPVSPSRKYRMPPAERDWLYLDELSSTEKPPLAETLYFVASPWKAADVEALYGRIHQESRKETRQELIQQMIKQLKARKKARLASVFYAEYTFDHVNDQE